MAHSYQTFIPFWSSLQPIELLHLYVVFANARPSMLAHVPSLFPLRFRFHINELCTPIPHHRVLSSIFSVFTPYHVILDLDSWTMPLNILLGFNTAKFEKLELNVDFYARVVPAHLRARIIRIKLGPNASINVLDSVLHSIHYVSRLEIVAGSFDPVCIGHLCRLLIDGLHLECVSLTAHAISFFGTWLRSQTFLQNLIIRDHKDYDVHCGSVLSRLVLDHAFNLVQLTHLELTLGGDAMYVDNLLHFAQLRSLQLNVDINIDRGLLANLISVLYRLRHLNIFIGIFHSGRSSIYVKHRKVTLVNELHSLNWNLKKIFELE